MPFLPVVFGHDETAAAQCPKTGYAATSRQHALRPLHRQNRTLSPKPDAFQDCGASVTRQRQRLFQRLAVSQSSQFPKDFVREDSAFRSQYNPGFLDDSGCFNIARPRFDRD